MTDVPSFSSHRPDEPHFGPREEATRKELYRREPALADLYVAGMALSRLSETGSTGYLLAHVGRELSKGVLIAITGGSIQGPPPDSADDKERNRGSIAAALELEPQHGLVTEWFQLVGVFARSCHYRPGGVDTVAVKTAFVRFGEVIYGLLAPYFDTQDELERLSRIEAPSESDATAAAGQLVRRQQRQFFFDRLRSPAWLRPLADRRLFDAPPERLVHPDGSWQMRPWPEGRYLARVAPNEPRVVTDLLCRVPQTVANPAVWITMIEAALVLPLEDAGLVAMHVAKAMKSVPPVAWPHEAIKLIVHLANGGEREPALRLADELLSVRRADSAGDSASTDTGLLYLDDYSLQILLKDAVPALVQLEAPLTLRILLRKLNGLVRAVAPAESSPGASRRWCPSLANAGRSTDARHMLAVCVAKHAASLAAGSADAAAMAWKSVTRYKGEIFERIRLWVLAAAGGLLQGQLDEAIGSSLLLDPPYGAREAAHLLRERFADASGEARRLFAYAISRGPSPEEASSAASWMAQMEDDPTHSQARRRPEARHIREAVEAWQKRRLRWFHDRIPSELEGLAKELGVPAEIPSPRQQDLDEVEFHSSSGGWVGRTSPRSAEDLCALTLEELCAFLVAWKPTTSRYEGPSYGGLHEALAAYATQNPGAALEAARTIIGRDGRPGYVTALLVGIGKRNLENSAPSWRGIIAVAAQTLDLCEALDVEALVHATGYDDSAPPEHASTWHQLLRALIAVLEQGCRSNLLDRDLAPNLWGIVSRLVASDLVWTDTFTMDPGHALNAAITAGLNTASGEATHLLIETALWEYRAIVRERGLDPPSTQSVAEIESNAGPLLAAIWLRTAESSNGARAVVGALLPQVRLVAPSWFAGQGPAMFDRGSATPLDDPAFGAFLSRGTFFESTFDAVRRTYVEAAHAVQKDAPADEDRLGAAGEGLVRHVLIGTLRGQVTLADDDKLLQLVFANARPKDVAHGYWEIYRGWSDTTDVVPAEFVQRLITLWEWRIGDLEGSPDQQEEAEGLLWLLMVPQIPASDAIRLGEASLRLVTGQSSIRWSIWERVAALANHDPNGTFAIVEILVDQELRHGYGLMPLDRVGPSFRTILAHASSDVRERAVRLVHRLGEAGHPEFRSLLDEVDGAG